MPIVEIDGNKLTTLESFHTTFAAVMGFPDFYGRNFHAWIDCMTSLDEPSHGMSKVHCTPPDVVTLSVSNAAAIPTHLWIDLLECAAFVNFRRIEMHQPPVLAISAHRTST